MPIAEVLTEFDQCALRCEKLIIAAHREDGGQPLFSPSETRQITIAAFLNLFIGWETFIEGSLLEFMLGGPTLAATQPIRFVAPVTLDAARGLVIGVNRFFDYGNHDNLRKVVNLYFDKGYPFEPHLTAIMTDLSDIKTMRNASAHITSTTQKALDGLALRLLSRPTSNTDLYDLLMASPGSTTAGQTVFSNYTQLLTSSAHLIATG